MDINEIYGAPKKTDWGWAILTIVVLTPIVYFGWHFIMWLI